MTYPSDLVECATNALRDHDALVASYRTEPESDEMGMPVDPDEWMRWSAGVYRPAYVAWEAAITELETALSKVGEKTSRHPLLFRPMCESIIGGEVAAMRER